MTTVDKYDWSLKSCWHEIFEKANTKQEAFDGLVRCLDCFIKIAIKNLTETEPSANTHFDGLENAPYVEERIKVLAERESSKPEGFAKQDDETRKLVLTKTLDRLLGTDFYTDEGDSTKFDQVFSELIKVSIIAPLTRFMDSLITDDNEPILHRLVRTMESCGEDLSVASILNSETDQSKKLKALSHFNLKKINNPELCNKLWDLFYEAYFESETSSQVKDFLKKNLPRINTLEKGRVGFLIAVSGKIDDPSEIYAVLQDLKADGDDTFAISSFSFEVNRALKSFVQKALDEGFRQPAYNNITGHLLAKVILKFSQIDQDFSQAILADNGLVSIVFSLFKRQGLLPDFSIALLDKLIENETFKPVIAEKMKQNLNKMDDKIYDRSRNFLPFLFKVLGEDDFKEIFCERFKLYRETNIDQEIRFTNQLFDSANRAEFLKRALSGQVQSIVNDREFALAWLPVMAETAHDGIAFLSTNENHFWASEKMSKDFFHALAQFGTLGLDKLVSLEAANRSSRDSDFYIDLIDAVCSRFDKPENIKRKKLFLEENEGKPIDTNFVSLSFLDEIPSILSSEKLANFFMKLFSLGHDEQKKINERLLLWLKDSSFSEGVLSQMSAKLSEPQESVLSAKTALKYLRYLSSYALSA